MSEIIPAILATSISDLDLKLARIPKEIKFVHIDVLEEDIWTDTIGANFEVHLMVREPEKIIAKWIERGARRVIVHESSPEILEYRGKVEIGLEIEMQEFLLKEFEQVPSVDFIHIMSIDEIGEQGHPFNPQVFDRIKQVRGKFPKVTVSVDGGVSIENYRELIDAGVGRLIIGSHFKEVWNLLTKK
ncbi:MAG: hypothetical protein U1C12_00910 [Patescibacteria group bacterium]|nr:hypothetical protein [Patescibacteria group bacterium]